MLDLALNSAHDLDTSALDLKLLDGAEQVRQQLIIKLKLIKGEWFLDTDFGTPYLSDILGKQLTLSGVIAALRKSILEVEGVTAIQELRYRFDNVARKLIVDFQASTPYGIIEVNA